MVQIKHLNKAPIVEALINIKVSLPSEFNLQEYSSSIYETLKANYPIKEVRNYVTGQITITDGKPVPGDTRSGVEAYIYKSKDGKNIVQFKNDGFAYNRLVPYTDWKDVRGKAKKLWGIYSASANPDPINQLALRYINKINLHPPCDLDAYFTAAPKIPGSLPQDILSFFEKKTIHNDGLLANITQTMQPNKADDCIGYILDIEVYNAPVGGIKNENMWDILDSMRDFKNRIFFESITEKTLRMLE